MIGLSSNSIQLISAAARLDRGDEALRLRGGYRYLRDFPIERYLRDVRMRLIIARRLLRQ